MYIYIYIYKEISTSNCQKLKLDNTTKRFIAFSVKSLHENMLHD